VSRPDAAALLPLAESIADGGVVDWEAAEAIATAEQRAVIRELRVLSNLVGLHRSLPVDDPGHRPGARSTASPAIGSWAHLTLLERLGGGTSGDVYRAWDRHLEREVALKLLKADESVQDLHGSRIAAEGRLLARVRHPNVVAVHGVDTHGQRVGLWMELVRGATLEQMLQEHGPLSAREAALAGIDLCRALAAIHAAGLIHRDVKAQNVMREDGGRIVLMDLGTGREADHGGRRALHDLAGTPLYLAPDIFDGAPASERTDLYSLGVLLYHLVTGSFPVRATTLDVLKRGHRDGSGVRLRDARADLPTAFVQVVDKAIAADPSDRYGTAGALEAALVDALSDTTAERAAAEAAVKGRSHFRRWALWGLVGLSIAGAAVAYAVWPTAHDAKVARVAPGAITSIAVLPLENLSGDPSQEYFADGMTDEIIGTLSRLSGINVISRTSAMQFRGSKKPISEIARTLHVDAVLEGSVLLVPTRRKPDASSIQQIRINARLVRASTDSQLWYKTFETVVDDVLVLQRNVANAIADGINSRLTASEQRLVSKASAPILASGQEFATFDLYLKGRYFWNLRTEAGFRQSIQQFQQAIARDPAYAPAYAGLADAYVLLGEYGYVPRDDAQSRAEAAASKALALDDTLAEAYATKALIQESRFDWRSAEASYQRAIELKPGNASARHWFAAFLASSGRFSEALNQIERALVLDPLSAGINAEYGVILNLAHRYDDAIAQLQRSIDMNPAIGRTHVMLANAYIQTHAFENALAEARKAESLTGAAAEDRAVIGYIDALSGRRSSALAIAAELARRSERGDVETAGAIAAIHAALGDKDNAFRWLNRSLQRRESWVEYLKVEPKFESLHADPRFANLLARAGLAR